jgi:hypothetical protein
MSFYKKKVKRNHNREALKNRDNSGFQQRLIYEYITADKTLQSKFQSDAG